MNKNKITILTLGCVGILIAGLSFTNLVEAANPSIYVSPTNQSKEVGDTFNISVKVDPAGQKVCMVEGILLLNKLSCQSISPNSDLMASPDNKLTCSNLYFSLGIPTCTMENKTLFTVTVKAENAGTATANFSGIDIIGEGVPISSISSGGTYSLIIPEEIVVPEEEVEVTVEEIVAPVSETTSEEVITETVSTSTIQEEELSEEQTLTLTEQTTFLAAIGNILSLGTNNAWISLFVVGVILAISIYFIQKSRRKKS